jgi:hypothetical protein
MLGIEGFFQLKEVVNTKFLDINLSQFLVFWHSIFELFKNIKSTQRKICLLPPVLKLPHLHFPAKHYSFNVSFLGFLYVHSLHHFYTIGSLEFTVFCPLESNVFLEIFSYQYIELFIQIAALHSSQQLWQNFFNPVPDLMITWVILFGNLDENLKLFSRKVNTLILLIWIVCKVVKYNKIFLMLFKEKAGIWAG